MATETTTTHTALPRVKARPQLRRFALSSSFAPDLAIPATLLFLLSLTIFWATRTNYNTFDAVSYANQIAHLYPRTHDLRWLFHPHHLLFNATGYAAWRTAQFFGYHGGPLVILESMNGLLGAAGIALFYLTLRRLMQRSRWLPLLTASGLALSFGYWVTATDGRVNMPSTVLLLAAFYVLCRLLEYASLQRAALMGVLAGAAVLYHESAGLFVAVGLVGILLAEQDPMLMPAEAKRQRRAMVLSYAGAWLAAVALPYLLIGTLALHLHSPAAFHAWSNAYTELGWWWSFHILHNLRLDFYALRHAAFVEPAGTQGTFHIGRHVSGSLALLYWATLAGWFVATYAFCAALPLLWRGRHRPLMVVCVVWIALYASFFTVWSPGYFVFWVPVLAPISLLLALGMAHYRAQRGVLVNWCVGAWILLFATLNVQASILPHLRLVSSPFAVCARDIRAHTQPGDLLLLAGAGDGAQCEVDIPYFADRPILSLHSLLTTAKRAHTPKDILLTQMQTQMAQAIDTGHAVYALDELWHSHRALNALHDRHPEWTRMDFQTLVAPYTRTLAWTGPRGPVWRLAPLPPLPVSLLMAPQNIAPQTIAPPFPDR